MSFPRLYVPVCGRCGFEMRCHKNGQNVHNVCGITWSGDTYECQGCGSRVIVNFGEGRKMDVLEDQSDNMLIK